ELVGLAVRALVLLGDGLALLLRVVGLAGDERGEGLLELEVGGRLSNELVLAERQKLAGAALGVERELQDGVELLQRGLGRRRARVNVGPAGDGLRELSAHVLDLGVERERVEVVGPLVEQVRDDELGVVQLAHLDQNARTRQPVDRRWQLIGQDASPRRSFWAAARTRTTCSSGISITSHMPPGSRSSTWPSSVTSSTAPRLSAASTIWVE